MFSSQFHLLSMNPISLFLLLSRFESIEKLIHIVSNCINVLSGISPLIEHSVRVIHEIPNNPAFALKSLIVILNPFSIGY